MKTANDIPDYILSQNKLNISGTHEIRLENLLVGNGWFIPLLQHQSFYSFSQPSGNTYDLKILDEIQSAELHQRIYGPGGCSDLLKNCTAAQSDDSDAVCRSANNFCNTYVTNAIDISQRDIYDIRELVPDPFPETYFVDYLNTIEVLEAIGAYQNFTNFSYLTNSAFTFTGDAARDFDTEDTINRLLESGVKVMMFFGDSDYICNWLAGVAVADQIHPPGYLDAGFVNISSCDGIVHGQVRQSGPFSFVRVYESGHLVPYYQPLVSLEVFERMIYDKDIATGMVDIDADYLTIGPSTSDHREGNATVQWGPVPFCATYNPLLNKPDPASLQCGDSVTKEARWFIKEFSQPFATLGVDLELFKQFGLPL